MESYKEAAEIALKDTKAYEYNAFKKELAKRTIIMHFRKLEAE